MISFSFDPDRPDFAPYGFTCVRWNPTPMRRPDRHNEVELNFLERGSVTYLFGGHKVRVEPRRLSAFWAAIPHQIVDYAEDTAYFVATLPLAWFLQCRLPENLTRAILHGRVVAEGDAGAAQEDAAAFARWERDLGSGGGGELLRAARLELEARLLRLARGLCDPSPVGERGAGKPGFGQGGLSKTEQMARLIAERYTERLSVEEIGRSVGLHPNYAMGLFHRAFGTTLVEYLTEHRISHAQRLLATTDEKVVTIALSSGFNSLSRFNQAFRRACGCTPRTYRREHRV